MLEVARASSNSQKIDFLSELNFHSRVGIKIFIFGPQINN